MHAHLIPQHNGKWYTHAAAAATPAAAAATAPAAGWQKCALGARERGAQRNDRDDSNGHGEQ